MDKPEELVTVQRGGALQGNVRWETINRQEERLGHEKKGTVTQSNRQEKEVPAAVFTGAKSVQEHPLRFLPVDTRCSEG